MEKKSDSDLLDSMTVNNGDTIPEYFIRFAGSVPVSQSGGRFYCSSATTASYFRMPVALTALTDTIAFRSRKNLEALKFAVAIHLKNQRGTFDMSKEEAHFSELLA